MIKNIVKHFLLITKHKILVFKLCVKAGIPFRGFMHDWSKYSITEFWESVRYYNGTSSPIGEAIIVNGYSKAWLHHKGRNKHHYEYWHNPGSIHPAPIIPYPYVVEMICDRIAAGMVYNGEKYTNCEPLEYWEKDKGRDYIHKKVQDMLTKVFTEISEKGVDEVICPQKLKEWYHEYCEEKI